MDIYGAPVNRYELITGRRAQPNYISSSPLLNGTMCHFDNDDRNLAFDTVAVFDFIHAHIYGRERDVRQVSLRYGSDE